MFIEKSKEWVVICLGAYEGSVIRPFLVPRKTIVEIRKLN